MVITSKTLVPLHPLSEKGRELYRNLLKRKADEILMKHRHPFLCFFNSLMKFLMIDSELIERKYNLLMEEISDNS